jgi:hypothetical protein
MDDSRDQTEEDILNPTVSDEALEASAGTGANDVSVLPFISYCCGGPDLSEMSG